MTEHSQSGNWILKWLTQQSFRLHIASNVISFPFLYRKRDEIVWFRHGQKEVPENNTKANIILPITIALGITWLCTCMSKWSVKNPLQRTVFFILLVFIDYTKYLVFLWYFIHAYNRFCSFSVHYYHILFPHLFPFLCLQVFLLHSCIISSAFILPL